MFFKIRNEIDDKLGQVISYNNTGITYYRAKDYSASIRNLEKSLDLQNNIKLNQFSLTLETTLYLFLSYKSLGKKYNKKEKSYWIYRDKTKGSMKNQF